MDATALVVAVVGVAGTLTAPIVSQGLAIRARAQELEAERVRRAEDRAAEQWTAKMSARQAMYVELNAAIRAFRRSLRDHLSERSEATRSELEQARRALDHSCAEAQVIATDLVLDELSRAVFLVYRLYDDVLGIGKECDSGATEEARVRLLGRLENEIPLELRALRNVIRDEVMASEASQHQ